MWFLSEVVSVRNKDRKHVFGALKTELDRITSSCNSAGALLNLTKANATWFSLNNPIFYTLSVKWNLYMMPEERSNTMWYSGVRCDRSLACTDDVDHVVIKARKGVAADGCNKQRHLIFYITSNLTMEVMAVSKDMFWLDT
jgi:hypothetical protein